MSESAHIFDADAASFESLVVDESYRAPVLVDFWAEWCAPCRALAPVLARVAERHQGRVRVVKVDTDREQALARQFGIRSLPTVKLFKDGAVVEEFLGVQPESRVLALLEPYVSRESDAARARARALRERGELDEARALLEEAHVAEPDNARVMPDLAEVLIDLGELERAREALGLLPDGERLGDAARAAAARLEFATLAATAPDADALRAAIEKDPGDCEARYRLSAVLIGSGEYEAALDELLEILRIDRSFEDDAGRKSLLLVFEMLGGGHPLVARYRARMSTLLY